MFILKAEALTSNLKTSDLKCENSFLFLAFIQNCGIVLVLVSKNIGTLG